MIPWKDSKFINPRKKVFKNLDTNEILNLELQDDPDNVIEQSDTPINAHNLNKMQTDIINDMSKKYTGRNIVADTVAGFGQVDKIYGDTVEVGEGDKSSDNPYKIKCVGDDINLAKHIGGYLQNGVFKSSDDDSFVFKVQEGETYIVSGQGNRNHSAIFSEFPTNNATCIEGTYSQTILRDTSFIASKTGYMVFYANTPTSQAVINSFKAQKGSIATPYSEYGEGTVEIISKNSSNTSSNIIYRGKPLCALKNAEGEYIARDYIDYRNNKVYRECGYINSYTNESITTQYVSSTGSLTAGATVIYKLATPTTENINGSNKIVQYADSTTIYNRDNAELEATLTNNNMISNINKNFRDIEESVKQDIVEGEEIATNEYINNKRVYKKILNLGVAPTSTKAYEIGVSANKVINISVALKNDTFYIPVPLVNSSVTQLITCYLNGTKLHMQCGMDRSEYTVYATIYYVKED